jgi:hypothetical protein
MKCLLAFCVLVMLSAASTSIAQTKAPAAPDATPQPFHYVVDPSLVKEASTYHERDGGAHIIARVKDNKGVTSDFVEDEVVVRNDPTEVDALVAKYHARVVRQITVNLIRDGKPLPPAHTTPMTVMQIDASSSPLHLEEEAPKIKAAGTHAFSSAKGANLAAIVARERAGGHSVALNILGQPDQFPTHSDEQADANSVSDAYKWPEFDHRAWQYAVDAGIKTHPIVAIIDSGFWLNSQGVPCGIKVDSLCQTSQRAPGVSDLPEQPLQADATGGNGPIGGPSLYNNIPNCATNPPCNWHGNRSASVALAALNNHTGATGTGAPAAVPLLILVSPTVSEWTAAIEMAVDQGASIISMSLSVNCGYWCVQDNITGDGLDAAEHARLKNVLVVAAAGNASQDAGANNTWPCTSSLCVGAMNSNATCYACNYVNMDGTGESYSNFGPNVVIWAPTNIHTMPDASSNGGLTAHIGTSASAPYVAGVAALMKGVNPSLTAVQMWYILVNTATSVVTSASPDSKPQWGGLIAPLEAVVLGNSGQEVTPRLVITAPNNGATVGQQLYQGVAFSASALDLLAGSPPASLSGGFLNGQPTWCAQNTCLPSPFFTNGILNWPFPTTALSLRLADANMATYGLNWPLPAGSYDAGPVSWSSSEDGAMAGAGYNQSGGTSFSYVFSPTAHKGNRTITATFKDTQGFKDSKEITVDYQPQIGGPSPVILYPPTGATFRAGTIPVRGYSLTGVNLGYLACNRLEWQQGIASAPIPSTDYPGATGICEAEVPFGAGSQTLRLTAKGPTGQVGTSEEPLTITRPTRRPEAYIDAPTSNQQFMRYFGQNVQIGLHAFVLDSPVAGLRYTWSWYPVGASNSTTIGTGQSLTWTSNSVCGLINVEVVVTSASIPVSESPKATTQIEVSCSSNG